MLERQAYDRMYRSRSLFLSWPTNRINFFLRSPNAFWFLRRAGHVASGAERPRHQVAGCVTLKEVYNIACAKKMDPSLIGQSLRGICKSIIGTANASGVMVCEEVPPEFRYRQDTPLHKLDSIKQDLRKQKKSHKKK